MYILMGILGSQGVIYMVEWFGEVPKAARLTIISLSAALISGGLYIWKEKQKK